MSLDDPELVAREYASERPPFPAASVDAAVANWVLYHLPELDRALGELGRVLRPGGRLVAIANADDRMVEDLAPRLPEVPIPFRARVATAVFVAERA